MINFTSIMAGNFKLLSVNSLRRWTFRGFSSIIDQGLFSGANFIFGVFLARWLSAEEFGAYAIGFAVLLFFYQTHFSFFLDPMGVLGPSFYADQLPGYLIAQVRLHFVVLGPLGLVLAAVALAIQLFGADTATIRILAVMALTLPFLLIPWLLRRVFYVLAKPEIAILGSLIYAVFLIAGLFLVRNFTLITAPSAIVVMAFAGLLSSIFMLWRLVALSCSGFSTPLQEIFLQSWRFGRWLVLSGLLITLSSQAQVFLSGSLLGLERAGAVSALQMFIQPMILSATALTALMTPLLAADFSKGNVSGFRRKAMLLSFILIVIAFSFELVLFAFRSPLERLVYNGKFSAYVDLIPLWGTVPIILAFTSGIQAAFQAARRPYALLIAALFWAPISLGLGSWLALKWDILGVALSVIIGYLTLAAVLVVLYWFWIVRLPPSFAHAK